MKPGQFVLVYKCVDANQFAGVLRTKADERRRRQLIEKRPAMSRALAPGIGYHVTWADAKGASMENRKVREIYSEPARQNPKEVTAPVGRPAFAA